MTRTVHLKAARRLPKGRLISVTSKFYCLAPMIQKSKYTSYNAWEALVRRIKLLSKYYVVVYIRSAFGRFFFLKPSSAFGRWPRPNSIFSQLKLKVVYFVVLIFVMSILDRVSMCICIESNMTGLWFWKVNDEFTFHWRIRKWKIVELYELSTL